MDEWTTEDVGDEKLVTVGLCTTATGGSGAQGVEGSF